MKKYWFNAWTLTTLLAVACLGSLVGWLVGQSGYDAVVLAGVLPAVLSIIGGVVVFRFATQKGEQDHSHGIIANVFIVLFVVFFYFFAVFGKYSKEKQDEYSLIEHFPKCSMMERTVNAVRKELKLPPLGSETFCGGGSRKIKEP